MLTNNFPSTEPFYNRDFSYQLVHLTYRLANSIPKAYILRLKDDYELALQIANRGDVALLDQWLPADQPRTVAAVKDHFCLRYDHLLHQATDGPMFLADQAAKEEIRKSWLHFTRKGAIELIALCVMSNHVHVILRHPNPSGLTSFDWLLGRHKQYTATQINRLQAAKGRQVWAARGFDRDIRPGKFWTVLWYLINNPLQAKMTDNPLHWRGTWVKTGLVEGTRDLHTHGLIIPGH